jgi:hypothetical protein
VTLNRLCIHPLQPLRLGLMNHTSFYTHAPEHVNVVTIAPDPAIADTGATSIFIMEGTDVANKQVVVRPLTINWPDGQQIKLTHVCNIQIVGLPTILKGHIVPLLNVASLIGIRPLCKAGCIVTFDDMKCDVTYNGTVILRGFKDPSTVLWMLPIPNKVSNTPVEALPRTGPCLTRATHHVTEIHPTNNLSRKCRLFFMSPKVNFEDIYPCLPDTSERHTNMSPTSCRVGLLFVCRILCRVIDCRHVYSGSRNVVVGH